MITFKRVQAIPLSRDPAKVLIRWEINHTKPSDIANYEFCVVRQSHGEDGKPNFQDVDIDGNPKNPPEPLALNPINLMPISQWIDGLDFPWFIDYSDTLRNLTNVSNYKVKCRNKSTQEEVISDSFTWDGQLDLVGLYICAEHDFLLKDTIGVPSLVFKGAAAVFSVLSVLILSRKKGPYQNCNSCYGTNWVGGFFKPIDTYIDFSPNPKNSVITNWGEAQENECNALLSNFPNVGPGDVIRELREYRLWRVVNVTPTEKRRCQMLQFARLAEIKPGDIEYSLPNDERFQVQKVSELETIKKKDEF